MKSRLLPLLILAFLISACTFSLAEDMTPPPNYIPPTPMPTLGPLYPAEAPDIENGAAIYAENARPVTARKAWVMATRANNFPSLWLGWDCHN